MERIRVLYDLPITGLIPFSKVPAIAQRLGRNVYAPARKAIVLLVGGHSVGKSTLLNWFFGEQIQSVSVAIETRSVAFVTGGSSTDEYGGMAVERLFPFLDSYLARWPEEKRPSLELKIRCVKIPRASLVTMVDTPGLVAEDGRIDEGLLDLLLHLTAYAQAVFVMFEPHQQGFNDLVKSFVRGALRAGDWDKLRFVLTHSDVVNAEELQRVTSSLAQSIGEAADRRCPTIDIRAVALPRDDGEEGAGLEYVADAVEEAVGGTLHAVYDGVSRDAKALQAVAETLALRMERAAFACRVCWALAGLALAAYAYVWLWPTCPVFRGTHATLAAFGAVALAALLFYPRASVRGVVDLFLATTARSAASILNEYYRTVRSAIG